MPRQRLYATSPSLVRSGAHVLAAAVLALPAQALAQWQSVHPVLPARFVDQCTTAVLRASENRPLRVAAGSSQVIEVLGHGIDLARTFDFTGGRAQKVASYGGAANVGRKCGPIGSVKVQLNASVANPPDGAPAERNFTLLIGDQRIPVTVILPARFETRGWHHASFRQYAGPLSPNQAGAGTGGGVAGVPQSSITANSGTSCQETGSCGDANAVRIISPPLSGGGSATDNEPLASLAACILGRGGDVRQVDRRLEIMLPDDRAAASSCLTAPSFALFVQEHERLDLG